MAVPANAEGASEDVQATLRTVLPQTLGDVTSAATTDDGAVAIESTINDRSVQVPTDPADGINLSLDGGETVEVGLPYAQQASDADVVQQGVVAYNNGNGSTTVSSVKSDASIQISTVIDSSTSPSRYVYPLSVPTGAELMLRDTGEAYVAGADGTVLLNVAAPQARDSAGRVVSTHYEVDGASLVQVVDLTDDTVFPVVADPYLWVANLIKRVTVTYPYSDKSKYKVNVTPTDAGGGFVGPLTWGAWESELRTKLGSNASKVTYVVREQLNCHLAGYPLSLPEFNLESWRKSMTWSQMSPYNCNYPEGGWGSLK